MDCYLKGYYGYKNFGDELLFFGVLQWIAKHYSVHKLYVEVGDKQWMETWIRMNADRISRDPTIGDMLSKTSFVQARQGKPKRFAHLRYALGMTPYRSAFKFFGGGEVLTDERKFPHDGRNIPLLFSHSVRKGQFVLLGGIATPQKKRSRLLYKILARKAQKIVVRDKVSLATISSFLHAQSDQNKLLLQQDFAIDAIQERRDHFADKRSIYESKYILINNNRQENTDENRQKIIDFCRQYPLHQKIFFPCDMSDDAKQYRRIKEDIPDLIYYNWTEHNIDQTLDLFAHCDGGIGCRLHFLLPLKWYGKSLEAIPYAEKIEKLILE